MESCGQDMDKESADEFAGGEGHGFVSVSLLISIVLPFEGDALLVEGDKSAIGDSDTMGIAGEIGEHGLGSGKGTLGIDHPLALSYGFEPVGKSLHFSQSLEFTEEAELADMIGIEKFFEEQAPEQSGEYTHGEEESRSAGDPS